MKQKPKKLRKLSQLKDDIYGLSLFVQQPHADFRRQLQQWFQRRGLLPEQQHLVVLELLLRVSGGGLSIPIRQRIRVAIPPLTYLISLYGNTG